MNYHSDFEVIIETKVADWFEKEFYFSRFLQNLHDNPFQIEFSLHFPPNYSKFEVGTNYSRIEVDGFLGYYNIDEQKIFIYLPVIYNPLVYNHIPKEELLQLVIYFEIGQWICYKIFDGERFFSKESFYNTGSIFRNFISSIITFELIKPHTHFSYLYFLHFLDNCSDDSTFYLTFVKNSDYNLSGLGISDVIKFAGKIMRFQKKDVTKEDICRYFNNYITSNIRKNPESLRHFYKVLTTYQLMRYKNLYPEIMAAIDKEIRMVNPIVNT